LEGPAGELGGARRWPPRRREIPARPGRIRVTHGGGGLHGVPGRGRVAGRRWKEGEGAVHRAAPMAAGSGARSSGGFAARLASGPPFMVDTRASSLPQRHPALTRRTTHRRLARAGSLAADRWTIPSVGAANVGAPRGGARTSGTLGVLPTSGGVASGRRELGPDFEASATRDAAVRPSQPKCVAGCRFEHLNL
jgi:hypothetical protein